MGGSLAAFAEAEFRAVYVLSGARGFRDCSNKNAARLLSERPSFVLRCFSNPKTVYGIVMLRRLGERLRKDFRALDVSFA